MIRFLLLAGLLVPVPAYAGPILVNGSFELGPPPFSNQDIDIPSGSTAITGWTVTGGGIDLLGVPWDVPDGVRGIDLDGRHPGGIEQTFATIVGQLYTVSFALSGNPGNGLPGTGLPALKGVRVAVDGITHDYTFDSSGQSISALVWDTEMFSFFASSTTETLSFTSLETDPNAAYGALVDNVSVSSENPETVPEPGTLLLLGAGLLIRAAASRARRKRVTPSGRSLPA